MLEQLSKYPGNKDVSGVRHEITNVIPPCDILISGCAGSGGIVRNVLEVPIKIFNDIDPDITNAWATIDDQILVSEIPIVQLLDCLEDLPLKIVIYIDAPYPLSSRRSSQALYNYEMTDTDHALLCRYCTMSSHYIILSTYPNAIYADSLAAWYTKSFQSSTHVGSATEVIYFNFPEGIALQDYSCIGKGYSDRQRIKRKKEKWVVLY